MKSEIRGCDGCPFLQRGHDVIERRCRANGRELPVNTRPPYGGEPTPDWCPAREGVEVRLVPAAPRRVSAFAKMAAAQPTRSPGEVAAEDRYAAGADDWDWFET